MRYVLKNKNSPTKFTTEQIDVLNGLMLGDGSLEMHGKKPRLVVVRCGKDLDYLEWQYNVFKNFCLQGIVNKLHFDKRTNKFYDRAYFRTCVSSLFTPFQNKWYNKCKIIPKDLILNDLTVATWILDDGHFEKFKNKKVLKLILSTNCFTLKEVQFLNNLLNNTYNTKFRIMTGTNKSGKNFYYIYGSNYSVRILLRKIDKVIPENIMNRKTYIWRNPEVQLYNDDFLKLRRRGI